MPTIKAEAVGIAQQSPKRKKLPIQKRCSLKAILVKSISPSKNQIFPYNRKIIAGCQGKRRLTNRPIYPIIQEMTKDKKATPKKILKTLKGLEGEIKEKYKAVVVGIFGSYARGEQKKKSDLDVLVRFYDGATLFEFGGLAIFLEEKLRIKKVDVVPLETGREELKEAVYI